MKILYLTKYTRKGASSRLRSYQYFPLLEAEGFDVTVKPLFSDGYLDRLYTGKSTAFVALQCYIRRFFVLFTVFRFHKLVIEKELFPYLPAWFERIFNGLGIAYAVDYDDAVFHTYDSHPNKLIRWLLADKIDKVIRFSQTVIAGNDYLAARAQKAGAKNIVILPTVIDIERYSVVKKHEANRPVIGWIGSPSTFKYVKALFPVFEKMHQKMDFELQVIGATSDEKQHFPIRYIPWSEASEVASIQKFDVGIMPLEDSNWEKGKCSYKLIQYMACGIPVVASPVGMNRQVVTDGINGFLPNNSEQWCEVLEILTTDKIKNRNFALAGRQLIENEYTMQKQVKKLITVLV